MHVCYYTRREPVQLKRTDIEKSGNRPHEANREAIDRQLLLFDSLTVDFLFRWVCFFILLVKVGDYVENFALSRLRNLANVSYTLGRRAMN